MKEPKPGKYWDRAWSLVDGCTPVSEACDNCWLDRPHRLRGIEPGSVTFREDRLDIPLKRKIPTVYAIWSDLFHISMEKCPQHTFLILTKRPELAKEFAFEMSTSDESVGIFPWRVFRDNDNIWLGTTAENQRAADERIPLLLETPAAHHFVSIEPMLGPVDLFDVDGEISEGMSRINPKEISFPGELIDLVILGGESGTGARPMQPDWARKIRDDCKQLGIPFFFKQWGEWYPVTRDVESRIRHKDDPMWYIWPDQGVENPVSIKVTKAKAGRLLDGKESNELPWREAITNYP